MAARSMKIEEKVFCTRANLYYGSIGGVKKLQIKQIPLVDVS